MGCKIQDKHHIIPKSRQFRHDNQNIAVVNKEKHHDLYHRLFENMTPDEIIIYLIKNWWNNQIFWLYDALAELEANDGN